MTPTPFPRIATAHPGGIPDAPRPAALSTPVPSVTPAPTPRTPWRHRLLRPLRAQLTQGITPQKIALTLAIGSACALFPIFGATTLLCIIAAVALRLNQPLIHLLNQILWPAHLPVMYGCIRLGETVFAAHHSPVELTRLPLLLWSEPRAFFAQFSATALHAVAAWCLLAPPFIATVYFLTLPIARALARRTALQHPQA